MTTATSEDRRRKRIAILVIGAVVLLFAIQLVALALGNALLAGVTAGIFLVGWFVLRSYQRKQGIG